MSQLTEQALKDYAVKNVETYTKHLNKFNQKKTFLSFNKATLVFPFIWTAYRKMWGSYALIFFINVAIAALLYFTVFFDTTVFGQVYPVLFPPIYLSRMALVGLGLVGIAILVFGFYLVFYTNSAFMKKAYKNSRSSVEAGEISGNGINTVLGTVAASLLCLIPFAFTAYDLYQKQGFALENYIEYSAMQNRKQKLFEVDSQSAGSKFKALEIIKSLDKYILNSNDVITHSICLDDEKILNELQRKEIELFTKKNYTTALECGALESAGYIANGAVDIEFDDSDFHNFICDLNSNAQFSSLIKLLNEKQSFNHDLVMGNRFPECLILTRWSSNPDERADFIKLALGKIEDIKTIDPYRFNDMIEASIRRQDDEMLGALLHYGIQLERNAKTDEFLRNSINYESKATQILLEHGVDPNYKEAPPAPQTEDNVFTNNGWREEPIIDIAIRREYVDKVKLFLEHDANVSEESLEIAKSRNNDVLVDLVKKASE